MAAHIRRQHADCDCDVERNIAGWLDAEVMPDASVRRQGLAYRLQEGLVGFDAADRVDGYLNAIPASVPAQRGRGALNARVAFGQTSIVVGGDGALDLLAEGCWREELGLGQR